MGGSILAWGQVLLFRVGSGLAFCFLPLLIQTPFILRHYIAYDPALFINGKRSGQNLILRIGNIYVAFILAMKI